MYTGDGCRHTGTVAVPAELGERAHPARLRAAEDPSDTRANTAVHGRIQVILLYPPFVSNTSVGAPNRLVRGQGWGSSDDRGKN